MVTPLICDDPPHIKIWRTVGLIPEGKVACYGQIADLAGLPGRARLVGKALGQVPEGGYLGLKVPWHRVINARGRVSFPQGSAQFFRQCQALQQEGVWVLSGRVSLAQFQWRPSLEQMLWQLEY